MGSWSSNLVYHIDICDEEVDEKMAGTKSDDIWIILLILALLFGISFMWRESPAEGWIDVITDTNNNTHNGGGGCTLTCNSSQTLTLPACVCTNNQVNPTCSDGIKNQNEVNTDCGGVCPACVVTPTCMDGIQNQGETGVDCGGPCAACQSWIPVPGELYCGDSYCTSGETTTNCAKDCLLYNNHCGDGTCANWENKDNCPYDCWKTDSGYSASARDLGTTYHTWQQVVVLMKNMAAQYPTQVSYEVIGQSIWGNDIYLFKVGNPNGGKFMFDGRPHGPEDCGTENGIAFIKWVLTNNSQASNDVLTKNYLLFIPGINIDSNRRQNMRRLYPDGTVVSWGVDLNRNFATGWGNAGSSDPAGNYDYRGQSAASEPETQAVRSAMNKYKPAVYYNVHCGGGKSLSGSGSNTAAVLSKIQTLSTTYATNTISYYNPGTGSCGGSGYVCADGRAIGGGSGWLSEAAGWSEMPPTLDGYLSKYFWKAQFTIYLGMAQAVQ